VYLQIQWHAFLLSQLESIAHTTVDYRASVSFVGGALSLLDASSIILIISDGRGSLERDLCRLKIKERQESSDIEILKKTSINLSKNQIRSS
jgi:hypothetical protein